MKMPQVFISYARKDMSPFHWLDRLKLYLAPIRRKGLIDPWDDSRLKTGAKLRDAIDEAIGNSSAAIVLLGPGFFASDFIMDREVPALLRAESKGKLQIYPVVVDWVDYASSPFEPYLAINDRNTPLSSLAVPEQNKIFNELCKRLQDDLQTKQLAAQPSKNADGFNLTTVLTDILAHLDETRVAFIAQVRRRDLLEAAMRKRLKITEKLQYEIFFLKYYSKLNRSEKDHFDMIRAMTTGILYKQNTAVLRLIEENPQASHFVPRLSELRQHLSFWVNKYEEFFVHRPGMCVLYTGVEDQVPFPKKIEDEIKRVLAKRERSDLPRTAKPATRRGLSREGRD